MTSKKQKVAQRRARFRVGVVAARIDAEVNGVPGCALIDASPEGFALIVKQQRFAVGDVVSVKLRYDGQEFCGQACIRDHSAVQNGKHRYGVQAVGYELKNGLQHIATSEQRKQLRRLSARR